jgi:putative transposase
LPGSTYFINFRLKAGVITEHERAIVLDAIKHFHQIRYWASVAVVVPDHAQLILKPYVLKSNMEYPLSKILQGLKGFSARQINKVRGTKGALRQDDCFDRIVRDA